MKNLLIILIVLVAAGCRDNYTKQQIIGEWVFKNKSDEVNYVTFTEDTMFALNLEMAESIRYYYELKSDSILMSIDMNGVKTIVDYGIINSVSPNKLIIEAGGFKANLERTNTSKIKLLK